ncbi:hypothetical protein PRUPE_4G225900 [Prunus persica]|uniref:Uncharacterized protein n=1 Tax=Prunus persica TaxID=3760 RepID=A0A251PPJ4_PRUPE|nr:hypothetical protein PRUPE_4G225900 [Prunus persica]
MLLTLSALRTKRGSIRDRVQGGVAIGVGKKCAGAWQRVKLKVRERERERGMIRSFGCWEGWLGCSR